MTSALPKISLPPPYPLCSILRIGPLAAFEKKKTYFLLLMLMTLVSHFRVYGIFKIGVNEFYLTIFMSNCSERKKKKK